MSRILVLAIVGLVFQAQGFAQDFESELARKAQAERDPHQKLILLHQWMKDFPQSPRRQERSEMLLRTQQSLGRFPEMLTTSRQMAQEDPAGSGGVWLCSIAVNSRIDTPAILGEAERSARAILAKSLASPVGNRNENLAHRTLGWAALMRSDYDSAEQEFTSALRRDPQDGEVSYWLGSCYLAQKQADKALYHLLRSSEVNGSQAVPASVKRDLRLFVARLYRDVHGDAEGFEALRRTAQTKVFP